jgi:REP element-mobilizing transposase RayT
MPFTRILVHAVFTTKNRQPFLSKKIRERVWEHIRENCSSKKIILFNINGSTDHAHCLLALRSNQTISNVMNLIKGESSHWINKCKLINEHFEWQAEYWAASVSDKDFDRVNKYIENQESHHADKDFEQELLELIKEFGFEKMANFSLHGP